MINKNLVKKLLGAATTVAAGAMPFLARAQADLKNGLTNIGSAFPHSGIANSTTITDLIINIIKILLFVSGGIAVLFVIYGGFLYLTAGGNEEQAEKGKTALVNAIIGIIIVILAYVIVNVVVNLVSGYSGGILF